MQNIQEQHALLKKITGDEHLQALALAISLVMMKPENLSRKTSHETVVNAAMIDGQNKLATSLMEFLHEVRQGDYEKVINKLNAKKQEKGK